MLAKCVNNVSSKATNQSATAQRNPCIIHNIELVLQKDPAAQGGMHGSQTSSLNGILSSAANRWNRPTSTFVIVSNLANLNQTSFNNAQNSANIVKLNLNKINQIFVTPSRLNRHLLRNQPQVLLCQWILSLQTWQHEDSHQQLLPRCATYTRQRPDYKAPCKLRLKVLLAVLQLHKMLP